MSGWRHARAVLLLPAMVTVVIPVLIASAGEVRINVLPAVLGALLIAAGLTLFIWTVSLFASVGKGTLAPWDPTSKLVVSGPYRYVRNPMITGVGTILAGEALFFRSWGIAIELAVFAVVNAVYFPLVEEPGMRRRFGTEYDEYCARVPRWIPRVRP
jgi:protein-S-isoprenylcysteine O-methyltransferase Ste14